MANIAQEQPSIRNMQVASSNFVHSTQLCEANKWWGEMVPQDNPPRDNVPQDNVPRGVCTASCFLKKGHFLADLTLRLRH